MSNWSTGTNTIQEVDTYKNLTLQMLKVRKQGGGTEYFVRKNDVKLGAKHITQNGTYPASNDGKLGFSQVTVNVRGGSGSADSHGKPTGGDIKPGGAGSAVVGTDPETGNEVVIGVDEEENLVKTPLPSSIVLVTNPTKMDYNDGESIDLSGAVVVAKNADGTTWTDVDHPNGHVSPSMDPTVADISQVTDKSMTSDLMQGRSIVVGDGKLHEIYAKKNGYGSFSGYEDIEIVMDDSSVKTAYIAIDHVENANTVGYRFQRIFVVPELGEYAFTQIQTPRDKNTGDISGEPQTYRGTLTVTENTRHYTYDGRTVYYAYGETNAYSKADGVDRVFKFEPALFMDYESPMIGTEKIAWSILYGTSAGGGQEIALNWARPGDGKVLSTTMQIEVHGTAHSTESSSGTSGSGGGGTF